MPAQQCTYCNRNFNRAEHLLRHVRSHTKEKPFKCGTCGKSYAREDTLIRHAKSHCVGRARRIPLSEASANAGDIRALQNEDPSTEDNRSISAPNDGAFRSPQETSQADLQRIAILDSSPEQPMTDFNPGANIWDFHNPDFMDDTALWTIDGGILMGGVDAGNTGQLHDVHLQVSDYLGDIHISNDHEYSETHGVPVVLDLRNIWFTKIQRRDESHYNPTLLAESTTRSQPASSPREPEMVDEECRRDLSRSLIHPFPQEDLLPSSGFLNLCVRQYLKCFNPIFPIIHTGTFQRTSENGLLLISMASVGCLFLSSQAALQRGRRIFESLNKVILTSWDNVLGHTSGEILAMVQASIIGQTFAVLSGNAKHLAMFETYHGSMISFARREKMFDFRPTTNPLGNLSGDELEAAWKDWARREELRRIVLALKIHDAELSALLHRDPLLKHATSANPLHATHDSFMAPTALNWVYSLNQDAGLHTPISENAVPSHQSDLFTAYITLEGIGVKIAEDRRKGNLDRDAFNTYQKSLTSWHQSYSESVEEQDPDQLCLLPLWHWTYMNLLVDLDQLESAIGRDGPEAAQDSMSYVSDWISTPNSSRCMLHAFLIQKQVQSFRFDQVPALHVPRILFSTAVAWYCYIKYGPGNDALDSSVTVFDTSYPEFRAVTSSIRQLSSITSLSWKPGDLSSIKAATLCELGGLLRRMNEWGLAGSFEKVVARLVDSEA